MTGRFGTEDVSDLAVMPVLGGTQRRVGNLARFPSMPVITRLQSHCVYT